MDRRDENPSVPPAPGRKRGLPGCFLSWWGVGGALIGIGIAIVKHGHEYLTGDSARALGKMIFEVMLWMSLAVFVGMIVALIARLTRAQTSPDPGAALPVQHDPFDRLERPLPRRGMPTWLLVSLVVGGLTLAGCCGFGLLTLSVISRVGQKRGSSSRSATGL